MPTTSAMAPPVSFQSPIDTRRKTANSDHKTKSDRQGGRPPHIGNVERGSRDEEFVGRELVGGIEHQDQKGEWSGDREDIEKAPLPLVSAFR